MAVLLAPSLSLSQVLPASGAVDARASTADAVEARTIDPDTAATPARRSLMGMVMGALIESAEQQARRQQTTSRLTTGNATAGKATIRPASPPAPISATSSDIAPREQIAVESRP
jgi:hypothetical protein